jgi:hypothetical protein
VGDVDDNHIKHIIKEANFGRTYLAKRSFQRKRKMARD